MKIALVIVVLVGLGWAGSTWLPGLLADVEIIDQVPPEGLFAARRGTLTVTLVENGKLVAKDSRKVTADVRGSAKITWLVEEGSSVEEGEVVCRLDASDKEEQLEQREMDILKARADLDTAKTNLEIQQAENESSLEKSANDHEKAIKERQRYEEGDAPKERRNLLVAISEAETAEARARRNHENSQKLLAKEFILSTEAEEDEIEWKRTEVKLEGSRKDLELYEKYTLPMTLKDREVAVSTARRGLETEEKRAENQLRQKQVAVEQYSAQLAKLERQRDETAEDIEKMVLRAPSPGIIIYGDPRRPWRRNDITVGGDVYGDTTILTVPDLRVMQVKLRIHEADISKMHEGLTATVTMDTYPGLVLEGTVTRIASIASGDNRWEDDPEVKKFDVEVTLDSEGLDVELKPGVSAKAEVFIDDRDEVLYVPIQCVFMEEGQHWVYTLGTDGKPLATEVETGISNSNYIEILEGLDEGERVLLFNPNLPGEASSEDEAEGEGEGGEDEGGGASGAAGGGGSAVTE